MKKTLLVFSLLAVCLTFLSGCGQEELKTKALAEIARAEQKLEQAEITGVAEWSPQKYEAAKQKLQEGKDLTDKNEFQKAQLSLEDFNSILDEAIIETLAAKDAAKKQSDKINSELKKAKEEARLAEQIRIEEEAAALELEAKNAKTYTSYEVSKGDCLWNIARKTTQLNDPFKWTLIYMENKDTIDNPDLIFPGQVIKIPQSRY
jgi:nucleoid-associated protein YgaU